MTDDQATATLARIAAQDRAAFRTLYAKVAPRLLGVLVRMLRDQAEAEEALLDVFTQIWRNARKFDPAKGSAMTWIVSVARNHAIDRLRARPVVRPEARGLRLKSGLRADSDKKAAGTASRDETGLLAGCFTELPPDRATTLRDAYLDGLSYADLAERNGIPQSILRTSMRRALITLRGCLEQ